ncbi:MAG: polysaccharide biosynthesis protein [Coriobacteriia bacterium]
MSDSPWFRVKLSFYWSRPLQILAMMLADAVVVAMSIGLGYFVRFEGVVPGQFLPWVVPAILAAVATMLITLWLFGLYHVVLRYVGIDVMARLTGAVVTAVVFFVALDFVAAGTTGARLVPLGVILAGSAFAYIGLVMLRSLGRLWVVMTGAGSRGEHRVLIVGAGDAGSLLLRDIETQPQLGWQTVGYIDDDPRKRGLRIRSKRVLGTVADLPDVVEQHDVDEILVAMPSVDVDRRREILDIATSTGIPTRLVFGYTVSTSSVGVADLRSVRVEDLLGRSPNEIDVGLIADTLRGKVVAVTGAAGSIGSELCRQIMKMEPARLALIEIDETRLYELYLEMERMRPGIAVMRICDVRDDRKLHRVFGEERPQVVFHAAAYKHVPVMEDEPEEAIRANVLGTINVLVQCHQVDAERFVLISTDKAVDPRNVMGATKALAEMVMLGACKWGINAVAVRFGNVLASRGSVIPIFEEQLQRGGPITVTHPDVTRYFMTIPEASRLVLQAQAMSEGGDIFVLHMGEPVRIVDLAQRMISLSGSTATIEFTGLRHGEKLHEVLVHSDVDLVPTGCPVVNRLSALPLLTEEFALELQELIEQARVGYDPSIKRFLERLSRSEFEWCDDEAPLASDQ